MRNILTFIIVALFLLPSCRKETETITNIAQPDMQWSASVNPGWVIHKTTDSVIYHLKTEYISGTPEEVTWSADSLPSNMYIRFEPATGVPSFTTTMTVITNNLDKGNYTVRINNSTKSKRTMSYISQITIE
ncbi:MAG: hypothetical protein JST82_05230 [Bacteroidetes bacterium]|nr:hypothetical protein [Bacteroidota bacterium]